MIYVNDKKLDPDGVGRYTKEYNEAVKAIKKRGFPVVFRLNPNRIKRVKTTKGMKKEWNKNYIPFNTVIDGTTGSEKWVYTRTPPVKKDDNLIFHNNGRWVYKTSFSLGLKDIDQIFFLEYKCPLIKNGTFGVENKVKEAADDAAKFAHDSEVQYLIYSPRSPLSSFPKKIRSLAAAWGVINVLEKRDDGEWLVDLNIVKNELFNAVKDGEKRKERGYDDFVKATEGESLIKKRAAIQQAIDRKLIGYRSKDYSYLFLDEKGEEAGKICRISPSEIGNKINALNTFLDNNDYEMNLIFKTIEQGDKSKKAVSVTTEPPSMTDIQKMTWEELSVEAERCNVRYVGVKKDTVRRELLEYYEYA